MTKAYAGSQGPHKGGGTSGTRKNKVGIPEVSKKEPLVDVKARCDEINERIRQELNAVCRDRGHSYSDVARLAHLPQSTVGRIMAKSRVSATNSPKFAHVVLIYEALGLRLPFGPVEAPVKKYSQDELAALLAKVASSPTFVPTNNDRQIAERQAITLIATGAIQAL